MLEIYEYFSSFRRFSANLMSAIFRHAEATLPFDQGMRDPLVGVVLTRFHGTLGINALPGAT
jgi:hypothetical protein